MSTSVRRIERPKVDRLERVLGKAFAVLDSGFVRVIDYMGGDSSIVQAARVSLGLGTKTPREDAALVRYLMRHRHTTPFEMCELKLHVRVPMDCWRQWIRHRTANVNEYSTRYSVAIDAAQETNATAWRKQAASQKQGSEGTIDEERGRSLSEEEAEIHRLLRAVYQRRLDSGVAREQARKDLPLSTYTEAYWKIDLHNLLHFLELRLDERAQIEIRSYAKVIGREIVKRWVPVTWRAFEDYRLHALILSILERKIVAAIAAGDPHSALAIADSAGWLLTGPKGLRRHRERQEAEEKLIALGLTIPWGG